MEATGWWRASPHDSALCTHAPRDFRVWPEDDGHVQNKREARVCTAVERVGIAYGSISCNAIPLNLLL